MSAHILQARARAMIARALGADGAAFAVRLERGMRPVKAAMAAGACDARIASMIAPLALSVDAAGITAAYTGAKSCMHGADVGPYYAALGVACLWSANFRALVVWNEELGQFVAPRAYGIEKDPVVEALTATGMFSVDRERFGELVRTEHTETRKTCRTLVHWGNVCYDWRAPARLPMPSDAVSAVCRALQQDVGPWHTAAAAWDSWCYAERWLRAWLNALQPTCARLLDCTTGRESAPSTLITASPLGVRIRVQAELSRQYTIAPPLYRRETTVRARSRLPSRVRDGEFQVIPYLDFPDDVRTVRVMAASELLDTYAVGHAIEARYAGWREW